MIMTAKDKLKEDVVETRTMEFLDTVKGLEDDLLEQARTRLEEQRLENDRLRTFIKDRGEVIKSFTDKLQKQADANNEELEQAKSSLARSEVKNAKLVDYVSRLEEANRKQTAKLDKAEATEQVLAGAMELEKKLQDELMKKEKLLQDSQQLYARREREMLSLREKLREESERVKRLDGQLAESIERRSSSEEDKRELSSELSDLRDLLQKEQAKVLELEENLREDVLNAKVSEVEKEREDAVQHIIELRHEMELRQATHDKEKVRWESMEKARSREVEELAEARKQAMLSMDELRRAREKDGEAFAAKERKQAYITEKLLADLNTASSQRDETSEELKSLQVMLSKAKEAHEEREAQLGERITSLNGERDALTAELAEERRLTMRLTAEKDSRMQKGAEERDGLVRKVQELEQARLRSAEELNALSEQYTREKEEVRSRERELLEERNSLLAAHHQTAERIAARSSEIEQLRGVFESAKSDFDRSEKDLREKMRNLRSERDQLSEELRNRKAKFTREIATYEDELSRMRHYKQEYDHRVDLMHELHSGNGKLKQEAEDAVVKLQKVRLAYDVERSERVQKESELIEMTRLYRTSQRAAEEREHIISVERKIHQEFVESMRAREEDLRKELQGFRKESSGHVQVSSEAVKETVEKEETVLA